MKATVLVRPKEGILDPQGEAVESLAATSRLLGGRGAGRPGHRHRRRRRVAGRRARGDRADVRAPLDQPTHRELRDRAGGGRVVNEAPPRIGVLVFPRVGRRPRRRLALGALGAEPSSSGTPRRSSRPSTPSSFRAGSPTATICAAERSPASRRQWALSDHAGGGRPRSRHLQRLPDPLRGRPPPGILRPNASLQFVCRDVALASSAPTRRSRPGARPGSADDPREAWRRGATTRLLTCRKSRLLRYASGQNPNGSELDIAGVVNADGNVLGLMPHPEHAVDRLLDPATARSCSLRSWIPPASASTPALGRPPRRIRGSSMRWAMSTARLAKRSAPRA